MAKGFIFDVDGTILDSMEIWMDAAKLYLKDLGIEAEENLGDIMFSLTMAEGAEYIRKTYKVNLSDKENLRWYKPKGFLVFIKKKLHY